MVDVGELREAWVKGKTAVSLVFITLSLLLSLYSPTPPCTFIFVCLRVCIRGGGEKRKGEQIECPGPHAGQATGARDRLGIVAFNGARAPRLTAHISTERQTRDDRTTIEAGRNVSLDRTSPDLLRARFDLRPATHERTVNGHKVPGGWAHEGEIRRLYYVAGAGGDPRRAAELRAWADGLDAVLSEGKA